jgi:hypothetical protein
MYDVDYSPNFLKVVRVREVPVPHGGDFANLGTPTEHTNVLMDDSFCHP